MDFYLEIISADDKSLQTLNVGTKYSGQAIGNCEFLVGRSVHCDIVIPCTVLNRQAFILKYENGEFFITSLKDSPGLFVNSNLVPVNSAPVAIKNGEEIRFGKRALVLLFHASQKPASPKAQKTDQLVEDSVESQSVPSDEEPHKLESPLKSALSNKTNSPKITSPKVASPVRFAEPLVTSPKVDKADFYDVNAIETDRESPLRRELSPSTKAALARSPSKSPRSPIRDTAGSPHVVIDAPSTPKNDKSAMEQIGYALATPLRLVASPFRPATPSQTKEKSFMEKTLSVMGNVLASPVVIPAKIVSAAFSGTIGRQRSISAVQHDIAATAKTVAESDDLVPAAKARRSPIASPTAHPHVEQAPMGSPVLMTFSSPKVQKE